MNLPIVGLDENSNQVVDIDEDDLPVSRHHTTTTTTTTTNTAPASNIQRRQGGVGFSDDQDGTQKVNYDEEEDEEEGDGDDNNGRGLVEESFRLDEEAAPPQRLPSRNANRSSFVYAQSLRSSDNGEQAALEFRPGVFLCFACMVLSGVILGAAGTAMGMTTLIRDANDSSNNQYSSTSAPSSGGGGGGGVGSGNSMMNSTLEQVYERGYVTCGTGPATIPGFLLQEGGGGNPYVGMEFQLCTALAAALFQGKIVNEQTNEPRYKIVIQNTPQEQFQALGINQTIDVLLRATRTMETDVYEPTTKQGFQFTTPYFWDPIIFGGLPQAVACAEAWDFSSSQTCTNTRICIRRTHQNKFPQDAKSNTKNIQWLESKDLAADITSFFPTQCNVMAGPLSTLNAASLQRKAYSGPYALGQTIYAKQPISIMTRQGDPRWSDFLEWIIQTFIYAEEQGINKNSANSRIAPTDVFVLPDASSSNPTFATFLRDAVALNGNYGELYNFNLQSVLLTTRKSGINDINPGNSPIMHAFPFGDLDVVAPELEVRSPTVQAIKQRGFLNCGINTRRGFAEFNVTTKQWSGFDVDLCRALAAALFDGVERVVFTDLPAAQRFPVLADKRVDVLARLTTLTLQRDVKEPSANIGLSFATPYFYDGLTFGGIPPWSDCADNLDVISTECQSLKVCLLQGTTMLSRVQGLLRNDYISAKLTFKEVIDGLNDGTCNAIAGGFHDVAVETIRLAGYTAGNYSVGVRRYSKDPLALTTRQDDPAWSDFVFWVFGALIYADEHNITQETAFQMPRPKSFGPLRTSAFYLAVNAVGNYGQVYDRNFGALIPRAGMHLIHSGNKPMHYAMPGIPTNA